MAPLIEVRHLKKYFKTPRGMLHAVDDVSFAVEAGRTLGVVGESGCGKSTLGRVVLGLLQATAGEIWFDGKNITGCKGRERHELRREMQIIFQDPSASLDPRMTVGEIVGEALDIHRLVKSRRERRARILELLAMVGLNEEQADRYPHEFSGGQQQRVGIARALAVEPEFIVCDEPISALDVSIQSQVVNMLEDLQKDLGLTYLFIAHDISVVRHISDRIGVMYMGSLVELAESFELSDYPLHPYTRTLLSAVPVPDPDRSRARQRIILEGDIPSPIDPPPGCRFASRCPNANDKCRCVTPELREVSPGHYAACHLYNKL